MKNDDNDLKDFFNHLDQTRLVFSFVFGLAASFASAIIAGLLTNSALVMFGAMIAAFVVAFFATFYWLGGRMRSRF